MRRARRARPLLAVAGAAAMTVAACAGCGASAGGSGGTTITMEANSVAGGTNGQEASWLTKDVIPGFEKEMKAKGQNVTVNFEGSGASGEDYANRLALDLKSGGGPDVFDLDGPYYGEFVQAGYLKPLSSVVGPAATSWSGWSQIPTSVQSITEYQGKQYGIPNGTDGRVLFYNKALFRQAGLPASWQPTSWADIISAAKRLKAKDPGIEALQIDGGAQMGEATTFQGVLPLLASAGQLVYNEKTGAWQGDTPAMQAVAGFYHTIYSTGLANSQLQLGANGRDQTLQLFAQGKVGIYLESDYLYESVINSDGLYPMQGGTKDVGWALIPAQSPGKGIRGQSFISMSGGSGQSLNPNTKHPKLAWDFLSYMNSQAALLQYEKIKAFLSANADVNKIALAKDPFLSFVASKVLPLTAYRPSLAIYPQVSVGIQQLAQNLATGKSPASALSTYQTTLEKLVGASHIAKS